jgi:L-2-hydroxycarboxylate dehydrogenase (NAD+)
MKICFIFEERYMSDKVVYIPVETLQNFMVDVLMGLGTPRADAEICADVIISSDLRGIESHGVGRLKYYYDRIKRGQHKVVTKIETVRDNPTTAVLDGHDGMGMVVGKYGMQLAIDKAKKHAVGVVVVRNSTHFGIAGYYPLMAVQNDMLGFTFTNARPSMCPTFGVEPILGTNPIAFGAPTDEPFPFLYDAATPITQRGKIEAMARAEKAVPEGWLVDPQNKPLTDPNVILKAVDKDEAAFLPVGGAGEILGGHKGYGLGTMVEILCASLTSGAFLKDLKGIDANGKFQPYKVGHFFLAIRIDDFLPVEEFRKNTGNILRNLRNSKKAPGEPRIYTAGEKEYEYEKKVRKEGVPAVPNLQKEIKIMQDELGLAQYKFPF